MRIQILKLISFMVLTLAILPGASIAGKMNKEKMKGNVTITNSLVAVQGYDLVSYHSGKPQQGNGNHLVEHENVTYIFMNEENQKKFKANPSKYLPAFGGYCAYGVSVSKKFVGDPEVWKIVDGKLYLNLDTKIQSTWLEDIKGNIKKADKAWKEIKDKSPSDL